MCYQSVNVTNSQKILNHYFKFLRPLNFSALGQSPVLTSLRLVSASAVLSSHVTAIFKHSGQHPEVLCVLLATLWAVYELVFYRLPLVLSLDLT